MPSSLGGLAHHIGHRLEGQWDRARFRIKRRLGWLDPVTIQPFRGYGDGDRVQCRARVLEESGLARWQEHEGTLSNLAQMFHRFESDEVAGARVRASFGGRSAELESDEEGYLDVAFTGINGTTPNQLIWQDLTLELLEPYRDDQKRPLRVQAPILIPSADAEFAVVSDIDDTILRTGATSLLRNLRTTLFSSVEQRSPFLGVAPFYRALQRGQGDSARNPIFYVSSSPWNLYDFLDEFIGLNRIPRGPMFLKDLGWDRSKFIKSGHGEHKLEAIETLMDFYPKLRFILIGDSGQHDAEIYRAAVERHPDRVLAVYIRDLSEAPERGDEAQALLDEVERAGIEAELCPDLTRAALNAAAHGWIAPTAVDEVRAAVVQGQADPSS